jgi:hypothetical protein
MKTDVMKADLEKLEGGPGELYLWFPELNKAIEWYRRGAAARVNTDDAHQWLGIGLNAWIYRKTGRPIYAWRTYQLCRQVGVPVPEWFFEYLDGCADRLDQDLTSPKQVAEAFGLDRRGRDRSIGWDRMVASYLVWQLHEEQPGASLEERFSQVADCLGLSEGYVRDAWYAMAPPKK